jgi:hypothetical protein
MCFGPAVPDGFGICYNPQNDRINFSVSAFHTCSDTDSDKFVHVLGQTLKDIRKLLDNSPPLAPTPKLPQPPKVDPCKDKVKEPGPLKEKQPPRAKL